MVSGLELRKSPRNGRLSVAAEIRLKERIDPLFKKEMDEARKYLDDCVKQYIKEQENGY